MAIQQRRRKRGERAGITQTMLLIALKNRGGILAAAAEELGVTRQNVEQRVSRSAELQAARREIEQTVIDAAEGGLYELIVKKKDGPTIRWYLERKGKSRGYVTSIQNALDPIQLEQIVASIGGDLNLLRAIRDSLDPAGAAEPRSISQHH